MSSAPFELIPAFDIETVPNWLSNVMVSAHAAIGNARASKARTTTTRLM
jgi:hypothetical protein